MLPPGHARLQCIQVNAEIDRATKLACALPRPMPMVSLAAGIQGSRVIFAAGCERGEKQTGSVLRYPMQPARDRRALRLSAGRPKEHAHVGCTSLHRGSP